MSVIENIFVKDGTIVSRETEGSVEFAPLDVLKTVSFRVKTLRWKDYVNIAESGPYSIKGCGRDEFDLYDGNARINPNPVKGMITAKAVVQQYHEKLILSYLDLGGWKEK